MRKIFIPLVLVSFCFLSTVTGEELSIEKQKEIIEGFLYVTGRGNKDYVKSLRQEYPADTARPLKCGTPAIADFVINRHRLNKDLLQQFAVDTTLDRPVLSDSIVSPAGFFMVHYTTTGSDAPYQVNNRTGGIPDYILKVADIFDSVYIYDVDFLGYPSPPVDSSYDKGGDERFDIYVHDLAGSVFGQTWLDSLYIDGPGSLRATCFMEIDNDYKEISLYSNRPLDAVRVTAAHEFFHVVQFGIDFTEAEDGRRHWCEMSAVWMEEQQYDHINDYYNYLPYFFDDPKASIQQFKSYIDLHPYASVVYPLFLSEKYNRDVIKDIWLRCAENEGPDFLRVTQDVIDSISGGQETFASVFAEFAKWNYFTGYRSVIAPSGVGYSEKANFPVFTDAEMVVNYEYPVLLGAPNNPLNPYHNAVIFLRCAELSTIKDDTSYWNCNDSAYLECTDSTEVAGPPGDYDFMFVDTTYWNCNDGTFPNCFDSTEVIDTTEGFDFVHMDTSYWDCNAGTSPYCIDSTKVSNPASGYEFSHIDSFFNVYAAFDLTFKQPWGVNVIYQLDDYLDSVEVETFLLPGELVHLLNIPGYKDYRTITMIFSPASEVWENYNINLPIDFGYYCPDKNSINPEYVSLSAAVLTPYPNPAVVSEMENDSVYFRFQMPTNTTGFPDHCADSTKVYDITEGYDFISRDTSYWICNAGTYPFCTDSTEVFDPNDDYDFIHVVTSYWNCNVAYADRVGIYMLVDIFNIAGEHVATISSDEASYYQGNYFHGDRVFGWNLKNQHGEKVASGVYLAFARAYSAEKNGYLIAEATAKIALIR